jgi:hypothetical protein
VLSGLRSDSTAPPEEAGTMARFGRIKQVVDLIVESKPITEIITSFTIYSVWAASASDCREKKDSAPTCTAPPEEAGTMARFGRIKQVVDLIVEAVETSVQ